MFRVKRAADNSVVLWTTVVLVVVMVASMGATVWLVEEIRKEQRAIREIVEGGVSEDIDRLGSLPDEIRWQFVLTVLVLFVLILSSSAFVYMVKAYLNSLRSLREIKVLAWDILANMDLGVITTEREGKITSVNRRGQELLSISLDCIGSPLSDICQNGEPLAEDSRHVFSSEKNQYDRDFSVTQNSHLVKLRSECHVLRDTNDGVLGTVLYIRDVTERMLIEDRMRRMERFMGLGTLSAGLHHEIKNPLSALSLHVQLLEERMEGQVDEEIAENLSVLKTEVTRIAGVLESFHDFTSIEKLNQADTDIAGLVKQTVELIRPQAQQQGVQLIVSVPDADLPSISADATRLEQVFLNLVMNALDEMRNGGMLSLVVDAMEGRITVEVSDTGHGIPNNIQSNIFDLYFTTKSDGSGMGLAVCDKIIRQHCGQFEFNTSPSGTTFRVSLPMDNH